MALVLFLILTGAAALYFFQHRSELAELLASLQADDVVGLAILRVVAFGLFVKASLSQMRPVATRLPYSELFVLSTTANLASYALPAAGGVATKAIYLQRRYGVGYATFAGIQTVLLLVSLVVSGVICALGLIALQLIQGQVSLLLWVMAASCIAVGLIPFPIGKVWMKRWSPRVEARDGWYLALLHRRAAIQATLWLLLRGAVAFVTMGWLFVLLNRGMDTFLMGGIIESATVVFQIVRITPGNVGFYEWAVSVLGSQAGITLISGLTAAVGYRLLSLVTTVIVSWVMVLWQPRLRAVWTGKAPASD